MKKIMFLVCVLFGSASVFASEAWVKDSSAFNEIKEYCNVQKNVKGGDCAKLSCEANSVEELKSLGEKMKNCHTYVVDNKLSYKENVDEKKNDNSEKNEVTENSNKDNDDDEKGGENTENPTENRDTPEQGKDNEGVEDEENVEMEMREIKEEKIGLVAGEVKVGASDCFAEIDVLIEEYKQKRKGEYDFFVIGHSNAAASEKAARKEASKNAEEIRRNIVKEKNLAYDRWTFLAQRHCSYRNTEGKRRYVAGVLYGFNVKNRM